MAARCIDCKDVLTDEEFQRGDLCDFCRHALENPDEAVDEYENFLLLNEDNPSYEGWEP